MPNERKNSDYIQIKFRMKEALRAKIEQAALNVGASMNEEAVFRLRQSFIDEEKLFKDQHMMALVQLLVGTVRMIEASTGERWAEDEQTRQAVTVLIVAFLNGKFGAPFHKPPMVDEDTNWLNDDVWLREAPDTALADAMDAILKMRDVPQETIDMIGRLIRADKEDAVRRKRRPKK